MKTIGLWAAIVGLGLLGASGLVSASDAGRRATITEPIHPPRASVAPDVAAEMNGPPGRVQQATKVRMHHPRKLLRRDDIGRGQGNGCMKGYGKPGQCLPLQSPAQLAMPEMDHPWTCPEVRELFEGGIEVWDRDPLGLDTNGDGVACGPGDG